MHDRRPNSSRSSDPVTELRRRRRAARRPPRRRRPRAPRARRLRMGRAAALAPRRDGRGGRVHAHPRAAATARRCVAVVGLGDRADAAGLRLAAGAAVRQLAGDGLRRASPCPSTTRTPRRPSSRAPRSAPTLLRATVPRRRSPVRRITAARATSTTRASSACARSSSASHARKDLVNTPPADLSPERFAELAVEAADAAGVAVPGLGRGGARGRRVRRHPRGRPGIEPGAAPRAARVRAARGIRAPRARRQGHHVRLGRTLAEARRLDGRHEVRHGRRGGGAVGDRRAGRARRARAGHRLAVPRREHAVRHRDPPERRAADPRRHHGRGAQHRRGGPARAWPTRSSPRATSTPTRSSTSRPSPARRSSHSDTASRG